MPPRRGGACRPVFPAEILRTARTVEATEKVAPPSRRRAPPPFRLADPVSLFSRISAATTAPAMRARGLELERRRAAGAWSLRTWRKEPSSPSSEPWLLLHGLGANAATWLPTLGLLGHDDLLVPELSAQGGTRGPSPAMGVRDAVEVLAELVEKTWPGRRVTVGGVSLGGWMGVRLALARPDLVARLLLV